MWPSYALQYQRNYLSRIIFKFNDDGGYKF